jgi:hypothetical protein
LPEGALFSYQWTLNALQPPDHHNHGVKATELLQNGFGCTFQAPVKAQSWAALGFCACLAASGLGEEVFLSGTSRLTQSESLLDSVPQTDRPDAMDEPQVVTQTTEVQPVLEQARAEDVPGSVRGRRTERKWRVIPFGRFRVIADDNLFISNTNPESDVSYTISPGIALGWGDYEAEVRQLGEFERYFEPLSLESEDNPQSFVFAKYLASASFFTDHSGEDALDHDALIAGRWEATKLRLGLRLRFQTLSGTDIDVGDRVKRKVYTGSVTSSYEISEKTSLEVNLYGTSNDYETQIDTSEWIVEDFLNYQILPKTKIALGTRFGLTEISGGSSQTFEQLVGRVSYYASSKLALSLDGGVEWRQFDNGGDDEFFTVFNFAATYAPFDGTSISASAFRRNSASVSLINEDILQTGVSARVRQRFFHRFYFNVDGGYQNSEYQSNFTGATDGRKDDTVYVKPSLSFDVTKFLSAETSYQYQKNESSNKETSFTENLVSFQINLQF